jgi:hypothetical protein
MIKSAIKDISYDLIDFDDEHFKISLESELAELVDSIKGYGILNSPLLKFNNGRYVIISGFKRLMASRALGENHSLCRIIDVDDELLCAEISIIENSMNRSLNVIEQIRSINLLKKYIDGDSDRFFKKACRLLRIPQNKKLIQKLIMISTLPESLLKLINDAVVPLSVAIELVTFDEETMPQFNFLFSQFKVSLNKQKELLVLVRELAKIGLKRQKDVLDEVICLFHDEIRKNPDKNFVFKVIRNSLYTKRYPEIDKEIKKCESLLAKLNLPDGIKFVLPDYFEGRACQMTIQFKDIQELKQMNEQIEKVALKPEMMQILQRDYV